MSKLQEELKEAQNEAAATKEELNSCRESLEKMQELLQVQTFKLFTTIFCTVDEFSKIYLQKP